MRKWTLSPTNKDMVTVAGGILEDDRFTAFTGGGKVVTAWVPIPIENTDPSGFANDYFFQLLSQSIHGKI